MLKKAGIIVVAAAAGLVAVGSFAFADETVSKNNQGNACTFGQTAETTSDNTNVAASLLGIVANTPAANAVAPITAQAPILNCNNIGFSDLVDSDSNNMNKSVSKTEVEDSFNTED